MDEEFLPREEPYHQYKLYAICQSSLTIVVLTGLLPEHQISILECDTEDWSNDCRKCTGNSLWPSQE